ncbi:MAG: DnaJ domain-containing protein [Acidimicrobiales bacterium]
MLLAELEVFHSRPFAPTRRVAVGTAVLPTNPAPGFGGLLLAGIAATFVPEIDPDLWDDLRRLTEQVEAGRRIPQPRLRHRLQDDRIGLSKVRHRLLGEGEELTFEIDERGAPEPHVLAAVYASARLDPEDRAVVLGTVRRACNWRGALGPDFVEYVPGSRHASTWSVGGGGGDPYLWALGVLGLAPEAVEEDAIQRRFRTLLREAHPDHGGDASDAAQRIGELTEARRILLRA